MATFHSVEATPEGAAIRLRFASDASGPMGWQVFDPATGAFLEEGDWTESDGNRVDLLVRLPGADGPYRVQVAPVSDRGRFISIDARLGAGKLEIALPRVESESSRRLHYAAQSIPKAILLPVRSLWRNRKLMRSMVRRDILARYRGSFGGAIWTFLNPLLLMATYFFVFGVVLQSRFAGDTSRTGYVLYFLCGMLPWLAFSEAVGRAPGIVLEHRNFVKKLVFPLETLPMNLVITGLVTELFGVGIFLAGLLMARGSVPASVVWLPAILVPQVLFTVGVAWLLAATGAFVRDLGQIMGFVLTMWFFLTPICWAISPETPELAARLLTYNPIWVLVAGYRAVFLENSAPEWEPLLLLTAGSLVLAVAGHAWFHRLQKSFADVI